MKKYMRIILIATFTILTTTLFAQERKINKGETWYRIYTGKSLEMKTDKQNNFSANIINTGNFLVFEYYKRADEYADMTDDEYMEKIVFEVPKNAKSFNFTDVSLKAAFLRSCFCPDRGWHEINVGFIKGKKINATTWNVEIDIMTKPDMVRKSAPIAMKFKATYKVFHQPVIKKK